MDPEFEPKEAEVGKPIALQTYSDGYSERVFYAGQPSRDVFSLIYEQARVKERGPFSEGVSPPVVPEVSRQLFFPVSSVNPIVLTGRRNIEIIVKEVTPTKIAGLVRTK